MGGAASSLARPSRVTGKDLVAGTAEVRDMASALYKFMYAQWEDKEIFDIANNPGEYVIALSDLITNQFHVLGYVTKRSQIGEIYFMRYDKLKPPSKDGEKGIVEQRENAMIIAFYFVRLFQILGSLLLVVKDFSFPLIDPRTGQITDIGRPQKDAVYEGRLALQQGVVLPRFSGPTWQPTYRGGGVQRGGAKIAPLKPLGPYEWLRYHLSAISEAEAGSLNNVVINYKFSTQKNFKITDNLYLEFEIKTPPQTVQATGIPPQKFIILTGAKGSSRALAEIQTVNITQMIPSVLQGWLAPSDPQFTTPSQQLNRYPSHVIFDMPIGSSRKAHQASVERVIIEATKDAYPDGVPYKFDEGTNVDVLLASFDAQKDFTAILERLVLLAVRAAKQDKTLTLFKIVKPEDTAVRVSKETGMPTSMKNPTLNEVYQQLRSATFQPHCVARALQLIDANSIQQNLPTGAKTSICRFSVGDKTGPVSLSAYVPVKAMAQLYGRVNPANFKETQKILTAFVGTAATSIPLGVKDLVGMGQKEEASQLSAALKRLQLAFNLISKGDPDNLADIQVAPPSECPGPNEQDVKSQGTALVLQSAAQQLLAYHLNMTTQIAKFLTSVFNIRKMPTGEYRVDGPKTELLFAGFPALEQLSAQARGLLVDYYAGCEDIYQGGVKRWREGQPIPFRPAPGAPAPAASAPPA